MKEERIVIDASLMKILPKRIIQYFNERGKRQMKEVANGLTLEPVTQLQKQDDPSS